jgi:protein-disulfide isomerase
VAVLLLCLGCSAQSNNPNNLDRRIERQVRVLFQLPPSVSIQIGARTPSEFPEYENLTVALVAESRRQEEHFLIAKNGNTLVRFNKMDLTKDPYAEVMKKINLDGRPWRGKKDAKVIIVSYDDFQCPFCGRMHQTIFGPIYQKYADQVKIVYKDFPLDSIHPWATHAAVDANCLAAQSNDAYWAFADYIHGNGASVNQAGDRAQQSEAVDEATRNQAGKFKLDMDKVNACLKAQDASAVNASVQEGEGLGIQGTPALFINGYRIDGALPPDQIITAIDQALRDANESAAASAPQGK